jgi:1-aminocyclopropane-1-carboxylate deaminase/D-cysteine desulfhydrase-like pyridoxal-dependent ACC family enzyme
VPIIEGDYVGAGYARTTPEALEAIGVLARETGLVLDPVYTAKAMAGLMDQARRGRWANGEDVVFLHTGGGPALWAYEEVATYRPNPGPKAVLPEREGGGARSGRGRAYG